MGNHHSRARPDGKMSPAVVRFDSRAPSPKRKDERTWPAGTADRQTAQRTANRKRRQRDARPEEDG